MYRPPMSLVALRSFVANGTSFARGARLAPIQLKGKSVQYLIAKGWIGTVPELYGRKGRHRPRPGYLSPGAIAKYPSGSGCAIVATPTGLSVSFQFNGSGWNPSTVWWSFGDGSEQTVFGATTTIHVYKAAGTYTAYANGVSATNGGYAQTTVGPLTVEIRSTEETESKERHPVSRKKKAVGDDAAE